MAQTKFSTAILFQSWLLNPGAIVSFIGIFRKIYRNMLKLINTISAIAVPAILITLITFSSTKGQIMMLWKTMSLRPFSKKIIFRKIIMIMKLDKKTLRQISIYQS